MSSRTGGRIPVVAAALILSIIPGAALPADPATPPPGLAWLAGDWCGEDGAARTLESWTDAEGGLQLGVHRDLRGGRAVGFEFLRIESTPAGLVYVAQPGGKEPTRFALEVQSENFARFHNPDHDFPKRISYRFSPPASLEAAIDDGTDAGTRMQWNWKRCANSN